jgi:hypothetical protein
MSADGRLTVRLPKRLYAQLAQLSRSHNCAMGKLLLVALDAHLMQTQDPPMAPVQRVLNRLEAHLTKLDRDQQILLESLGLLAQFMFTQAPTLRDVEQNMARALGRKRYADYIAAVADQVSSSRSLAYAVIAKLQAPRVDVDTAAREADCFSAPVTQAPGPLGNAQWAEPAAGAGA